MLNNGNMTFYFPSRVYGEKVAELPLIGTRFRYRQLGMCRILMNELETAIILSILLELSIYAYIFITFKFFADFIGL